MTSSTTYDLIQACHKPGCPVCQLENAAVERYLDNLFYESVNDVQLREKLRGSMGFCREHAWLAVDKRLGSALGFAIIYHDVVNNTLRQLESKDIPSPSKRWTNLLQQIPEQVSMTIQKVLYALTPHKHCVVCLQRDKILHTITSELAENLNSPEMKSALLSSNGLCLPHLKKTFESVRDMETSKLLLFIHREKLESLRSELAEFIRKNDYRFKDEGFGAEGDSWKRAISKVIGDRSK